MKKHLKSSPNPPNIAPTIPSKIHNILPKKILNPKDPSKNLILFFYTIVYVAFYGPLKDPM